MNIEKFIENDITVITLEGKLNTSSSSKVENYINEVLESGVIKLIIDLSKLEYISSAGLRIFLSTAKKIDKAGGKLGISSLNEVVKEIFDISGFISILNVYDNKDEALIKF